MLQFDCHCLPGGGTENVRKYTESSKAYYYATAIMKYRAFTENLLKSENIAKSFHKSKVMLQNF